MKDKISLPRFNRGLRDFSSAQERRQFLEKKLNISLPNMSQFNFAESQVEGRNIENLIGATQIPLGVAGPISIVNSQLSILNYYIPLATTEGALVASISRGCKAISASGGATVKAELVGITRGPVFKVDNLNHAEKVKTWIDKNFSLLSQTTEKTSSHLKLLKIESSIIGRNIFFRFYYDSSAAMGMNMATIATTAACQLIEQKTKAQCTAVAGNFDVDKKPSYLNFIQGRGRKVWAEVVIPKEIVQTVFKTTSKKIAEVVYRKCLLGSIASGSLGFNAHFANIIASIFLATGQDPAHIVEGSLGVTTAENLDNGDLYFSIYLPALLIGTVGGGTHLPTQLEALKIMQVKSIQDYAEKLAAAVLAGELSLIASLSEGTLATAHQKLGRKK